jgi:hypothetical protein
MYDDYGDHDDGLSLDHERSVHELHNFNELLLSVPCHVRCKRPVSLSGCRN